MALKLSFQTECEHGIFNCYITSFCDDNTMICPEEEQIKNHHMPCPPQTVSSTCSLNSLSTFCPCSSVVDSP